jgi:sugar O-acyltransferase (sialic acid O-acetyltransferase NeuD family)
MKQSVYIIGAGGHAKVVLAALEANNIFPVALYDDDASKWGSSIFNIPIKGGLDDLEKLGSVSAFIAIGKNEVRKKIVERFTSIDWLTIIHPRASLHSSVQVGRGTLIQEGCILEPDVVIGEHCILNANSMIGHESVLENYVHNAGAKLNGNVHICEGVLLGGNSTVHPGVTVGAWSKSAIASAIMRDVPPNSILIGNPARVMKSKNRGLNNIQSAVETAPIGTKSASTD